MIYVSIMAGCFFLINHHHIVYDLTVAWMCVRVFLCFYVCMRARVRADENVRHCLRK